MKSTLIAVSILFVATTTFADALGECYIAKVNNKCGNSPEYNLFDKSNTRLEGPCLTWNVAVEYLKRYQAIGQCASQNANRCYIAKVNNKCGNSPEYNLFDESNTRLEGPCLSWNAAVEYLKRYQAIGQCYAEQ